MTKIFKTFVSVSFLIIVLGCGSYKDMSYSVSAPQRISKTAKATCPLKFANTGLCGEVNWVNGPTADQESSFIVTFWNEKDGSSSGPWIDPSAQVGAFIRMTCCGSVFFPQVSKTENGKYLVSNIRFTPGKWEVYVQLKSGDVIEKQFITVNLDD